MSSTTTALEVAPATRFTISVVSWQAGQPALNTSTLAID
jgi:hypothetical protein